MGVARAVLGAMLVFAGGCKDRTAALDADAEVTSVVGPNDGGTRPTWQVRLPATPGSNVSDQIFGPTVLAGGRVVVVGSDELSGLVGVDVKTGKVLWRAFGTMGHFAIVENDLWQLARCKKNRACLTAINSMTGHAEAAVVLEDFVPALDLHIAGQTKDSLFVTRDHQVVEVALTGKNLGRLDREPPKSAGRAEARLVVREGGHTWAMWRDGWGHRKDGAFSFVAFDEPMLLGGNLLAFEDLAVVLRDGVLSGSTWSKERYAYVPGGLASASDGRVWAIREQAGRFARTLLDMRSGQQLERGSEFDGSQVLAVCFGEPGGMLVVARLWLNPKRERVVAAGADGKEQWRYLLPPAQEGLRTDPVAVSRSTVASYVFFDGRNLIQLPPVR